MNNTNLEARAEWLMKYDKTEKDIMRDLAGEYILLDGMTASVTSDGIIKHSNKVYLPLSLNQ